MPANRRGQLSMFLLVGIVLLLAVVVLFAGRHWMTMGRANACDGIETFVEAQAGSALDRCLLLLGFQGGRRVPASFDALGPWPVERAFNERPAFLNGTTLREELEACATAAMATCRPELVTTFRDQGCKVEASVPIAHVTVAAQDVALEADYRVTVNGRTWTAFRPTNRNVRLAEIHGFIAAMTAERKKGLLPSDFDLDVLAASGFNATVLQTQAGDIVQVVDPQSSVLGQPYAFAVANRFGTG